MSRREPARPRRRKPSTAARLRPFWILIALVAVLLVAGGVYALNWQGFHPRQIDVVGNRIVTRDEILARAGIVRDRNVWLQNPRAIAARIEAIPYIASATVRRRLPAFVTLDVSERVPYALVDNGRLRASVDHDLRVVQAGEAARGLPRLHAAANDDLTPGRFLTDPALHALRDDEDALAAAHVPADSLVHDRFGGVIAVLHDGVRVLLGDDDEDLAKKIGLIAPIRDQAATGGRRIAQIDLRAVGTPVVIYK